jgi:hypothetical protein
MVLVFHVRELYIEPKKQYPRENCLVVRAYTSDVSNIQLYNSLDLQSCKIEGSESFVIRRSLQNLFKHRRGRTGPRRHHYLLYMLPISLLPQARPGLSSPWSLGILHLHLHSPRKPRSSLRSSPLLPRWKPPRHRPARSRPRSRTSQLQSTQIRPPRHQQRHQPAHPCPLRPRRHPTRPDSRPNSALRRPPSAFRA